MRVSQKILSYKIEKIIKRNKKTNQLEFQRLYYSRYQPAIERYKKEKALGKRNKTKREAEEQKFMH